MKDTVHLFTYFGMSAPSAFPFISFLFSFFSDFSNWLNFEFRSQLPFWPIYMTSPLSSTLTNKTNNAMLSSTPFISISICVSFQLYIQAFLLFLAMEFFEKWRCKEDTSRVWFLWCYPNWAFHYFYFLFFFLDLARLFRFCIFSMTALYSILILDETSQLHPFAHSFFYLHSVNFHFCFQSHRPSHVLHQFYPSWALKFCVVSLRFCVFSLYLLYCSKCRCNEKWLLFFCVLICVVMCRLSVTWMLNICMDNYYS